MQQTVALPKREDLPLQDLLCLAKNSTDRWLVKQAFERGKEFQKKVHEEEKGI